ncbi:hypothetical protein NDN08_004986 [Rhodosorus marinus]|uniref:Sulfatase N-terminal domain-containing protein n=1 Tax=Rhodosorus marinus TaxID=101924 RepID=A0AAV8UI58_9RHOD|nr:hypothetical protein NDN08_004986 [Rhodosorus marinus]
MKVLGLFCLAWLSVLGIGLCADKPNVIFILVDDIGWADLGIHGSKDVKSPHIDELARDGVQLTDAYAPHHFCFPSRVGLMTGIHPFVLGMSKNPPRSLDDKIIGMRLGYETMPETLKKSGYRTYCIGKWHLGSTPGHHPLNRGYDKFFGFLPGSFNYKLAKMRSGPDYDYIYDDFTRVKKITYLTDDFTDAALRYLNDAKKKKKPFFMYVSYNAPHAPFLSLKTDRDPNVSKARQPHVAMIKAIDRGVGKIRAALKELGMEDDTMVMFSSDNGGHEKGAINKPFTEFKGSYQEGGLRVPWFITWPGVIKKGQKMKKIVNHLDIYPTLQKLAKTAKKDRNPKIQGEDIMPYITKVGKSKPEDRGQPHSWLAFGGIRRGMIRKGFWKVALGFDGIKLYNLKDDAGEKKDLSNKFPDRKRSLLRIWNKWNKNNILPLFEEGKKDKNPLQLKLVAKKKSTKAGGQLAFKAKGSAPKGEKIRYQWETYQAGDSDEVLFRDVWVDGLKSSSRRQKNITIRFPKTGTYIVRVNIETDRFLMDKEVKINVSK